MTWLDWCILAAVAGYLIYLLFFRKKKGGCCGDCSACGHACQNREDAAS